jgi:hypothetical protein
VSNIKVDINKVNYYRGIRIREHPSKDAVMYSIQLKSMREVKMPVFPSDRIEKGSNK